MNVVRFAPSEENFTPIVVKPLKEVDGDTVFEFEKGEYYFYEAGCFNGFFAPTNNETGNKNVVFPIIDKQNITISGNGSTFVFFEETFPFIIQNSKNIVVKDVTITTGTPPYCLVLVKEKREDGFLCHINKNTNPYYLDNGNLVFKLSSRELSTKDHKLSMHALGRLLITYLFAGDCAESQDGLPASFTDTDATYEGEDIFFKYRDNSNASPCVYNEGELISINLEERRQRDVFFLEQSNNTVISNINIQRGGGMGVIAQLCTDIEISELSVKPANDIPITLTADILHFVNCNGKIEIHGCDFASSLDDACNIHGNYSIVKEVLEDSIIVEYGHFGHSFLKMYFNGDILTYINEKDCKICGTFKVDRAEFVDDDGLRQRIYIDGDRPNIAKGMLIESAERMPDIYVHDNKFYDIPHLRLSGKGNIIVAANEFDNCSCPVYAFDLAQYWYESGRITSLTVKNNSFANTRNPQGSVITGVSGFGDNNTPIIHGKIAIEDNAFVGCNDKKAYTINGFSNIIIKNNTIDGEIK